MTDKTDCKAVLDELDGLKDPLCANGKPVSYSFADLGECVQINIGAIKSALYFAYKLHNGDFVNDENINDFIDIFENTKIEVPKEGMTLANQNDLNKKLIKRFVENIAAQLLKEIKIIK